MFKSRHNIFFLCLIYVLWVFVVIPSWAMRCGTILINEDDTIQEAISACGQPSSYDGTTAVYINKDGDGMNYYLHVNTDSRIDNITYSRN